MKRLLLLTCLVSITSASFSQINKGQWLIGGNASFSSDKKDLPAANGITKYNLTAFQLSPNAGYFITDKLAAGARISLASFKSEYDNVAWTEWTETLNTVSLSPFIRYYFLPKTERLNLFADAGYTYGRVKSTSKFSTNSNTSKATTNGYYISAGPAIFLTQNTALELTLSYNYSKQNNHVNNDRKFMVGVGFQIHLGK
jgi:opacity protein-like surface antigen